MWSAGQREFVPLLLGLYWLMPPSKVQRREDLEWALRLFQGRGGQPSDVLKLLGLESVQRTRELAESALDCDLKTFFFARDGEVRDISDLDPGAENVAEAGWGGLTGFSSQVGDVVAEVVDRESPAVP